MRTVAAEEAPSPLLSVGGCTVFVKMGGGRLGVGIRALAAGIILAAVASARAGPAKPNILFIVRQPH